MYKKAPKFSIITNKSLLFSTYLRNDSQVYCLLSIREIDLVKGSQIPIMVNPMSLGL